MNRIKKMRIPREIEQLKKSYKDHGITCSTLTETPDNYSQLQAFMPGPKNSPYEMGRFKLTINCGDQYPFRPPTIKFVTPVFHPNIDTSGKICLDILNMPPNGSYNPAITLESILLSIQLLLANPNPDDPLQGDAADMFKKNNSLFVKKAKDYVLKHGVHQKEFGEESENVQSEPSNVVLKKRLKLSCNK